MGEVLMSPLTALGQMRLLGGPIVDWIFVACVLMWAIVFERYLWFRFTLPRETSRMLETWRARTNHQSWASRQIRKSMISRLNSGMSSNLQVLRVIVPLCPLLGLLGTVSGMLDVFDSMAARGSADARTMANGVSEAMICTLTGLAVSITGLYPVYYYQRRVRAETEHLAETFAY
jgi:biopolymer transport protein ExbB